MPTSTGPFAFVDWEFPVKRVERSGEGVDQDTGEWNPGTVTETDITGHFDPDPEEAEERTEGGVYKEGDGRLFTETQLDEEDELKIHYDDNANDVETWVVKELVRRHNVLAQISGFPTRYEFRIVRARDHS